MGLGVNPKQTSVQWQDLVMCTIPHKIFWFLLQGVFQRVHDLLIEDQVIQASQVS